MEPKQSNFIEKSSHSNDPDDPDIDQMIALIPQHNQYDSFINFLALLANKSIPLDNIAYVLFMDVVKFYTNSSRHLNLSAKKNHEYIYYTN